ncbi:hypothetical protein GCM10027610_091110 [Dactylosporangium cerinum]
MLGGDGDGLIGLIAHQIRGIRLEQPGRFRGYGSDHLLRGDTARDEHRHPPQDCHLCRDLAQLVPACPQFPAARPQFLPARPQFLPARPQFLAARPRGTAGGLAVTPG